MTAPCDHDAPEGECPKAADSHDLDALRASPLFNLSLSSKELFHSNLIAWLCTRHPAAAAALFGPEFPELRTIASRAPDVIREEQHLDLTLRFADLTLVIENKVKSLPDRAQLDGYYTKITGVPKRFPKPLFLLLSLSPADAADAPAWWRTLDYATLVECIESFARTLDVPYERELLIDYVMMMRRLLRVVEAHCAAGWCVSSDARKLRLADLVEKRMAHAVADRIKASITTRLGSRFLDSALKFADQTPGGIRVEAGMTRALGLVGFVHALPRRYSIAGSPPALIGLGLQLQGDKARSYVECSLSGISLQARKEFAARATRCFDESPLEAWWPSGARSSGKFALCQFSGTFLYRHRPVAALGVGAHPSPEALGAYMGAVAAGLVSAASRVDAVFRD